MTSRWWNRVMEAIATKARPQSVRVRLGLEPLEDRMVLSAPAVHGPTIVVPLVGTVTSTETSHHSESTTTGHAATTSKGGSSKYPHLLITESTTTVNAGTLATFTVKVLNPNGRVFTGYQGSLHFTSTDTTASFYSDAKGVTKMANHSYTFKLANAGTHTFTMIYHVKGPQTMTATDTANHLITGSAATKVA